MYVCMLCGYVAMSLCSYAALWKFSHNDIVLCMYVLMYVRRALTYIAKEGLGRAFLSQ